MLDLHRSSIPPIELARVLSALVDALTCRAVELALPDARAPRGGDRVGRRRQPGAARADARLRPPRRAGAHARRSRRGMSGSRRSGPRSRASECDGPVVAHDAEGWTRAAAEDELALSVLADRRALWGTPVEPLPVADGAAPGAAARGARRARLHPQPADRLRRRHGPASRRPAQRQARHPPCGDHPDRRDRALGGGGRRQRGGLDPRAPAVGGRRGRAGARPRHRRSPRPSSSRSSCGSSTSSSSSPPREPPDDLLDPAALSPLTRGHLRDVFRAVGTVTRELAP